MSLNDDHLNPDRHDPALRGEAFTAEQLRWFIAYREVQRGGRYNMLSPKARIAAGLSVDEYGFVLDHYEALAEAAQKE